MFHEGTMNELAKIYLASIGNTFTLVATRNVLINILDFELL